MTPQELMNLPFAGMAKTQLEIDGKWSHLLTDTDRIEWLADNVSHMTRDENKSCWKFVMDFRQDDADFFREDIDAAANMEAQQ
jgi:hypothetical protein